MSGIYRDCSRQSRTYGHPIFYKVFCKTLRTQRELAHIPGPSQRIQYGRGEGRWTFIVGCHQHTFVRWSGMNVPNITPWWKRTLLLLMVFSSSKSVMWIWWLPLRDWLITSASFFRLSQGRHTYSPTHKALSLATGPCPEKVLLPGLIPSYRYNLLFFHLTMYPGNHTLTVPRDLPCSFLQLPSISLCKCATVMLTTLLWVFRFSQCFAIINKAIRMTLLLCVFELLQVYLQSIFAEVGSWVKSNCIYNWCRHWQVPLQNGRTGLHPTSNVGVLLPQGSSLVSRMHHMCEFSPIR